ncbi:hypothetical protein K437DRAFT_269259 [Tilletiaria anomala UBC 951]|uniref:Uncharacterized protein n=1 Tax=Tilletiaria anomala (strain ATCC 24038 / CBS 436.72 / UBC 951) TaxID=1037660 RepID=A0A066VNG4_TILAU|nr:uncharacterized protein K437DRAFT_269259 [Tilletiaria anomala UBC 951]KDN43011.1 hypothetical protein K437DRAFT_269259 [Tilletiaria anomala UBC 951]
MAMLSSPRKRQALGDLNSNNSPHHLLPEHGAHATQSPCKPSRSTTSPAPSSPRAMAKALLGISLPPSTPLRANSACLSTRSTLPHSPSTREHVSSDAPSTPTASACTSDVDDDDAEGYSAAATEESDSELSTSNCETYSSTESNDHEGAAAAVESMTRRRKRRKPLPVIFFGTPSTAEHERRVKYETKLRERRLLRRDSLDLARRRTMTAADLERTLPPADSNERQAHSEPDFNVPSSSASSVQDTTERPSSSAYTTRQLEAQDTDTEPESPSLRSSRLLAPVSQIPSPSLSPVLSKSAVEAESLQHAVAEQEDQRSATTTAGLARDEPNAEISISDPAEDTGSTDLKEVASGKRSSEISAPSEKAAALAALVEAQEPSRELKAPPDLPISMRVLQARAQAISADETITDGFDTTFHEGAAAAAGDVSFTLPLAPLSQADSSVHAAVNELADMLAKLHSTSAVIASPSYAGAAVDEVDAEEQTEEQIERATSQSEAEVAEDGMDALGAQAEKCDQSAESIAGKRSKVQGADDEIDQGSPVEIFELDLALEFAMGLEAAATKEPELFVVQPSSDAAALQDEGPKVGHAATPQRLAPSLAAAADASIASNEASPGVALSTAVFSPISRHRLALQDAFGQSPSNGSDFGDTSPARPQRRRSARLSAKLEELGWEQLQEQQHKMNAIDKENMPPPLLPASNMLREIAFDPFASSSPTKSSPRKPDHHSPANRVPQSPSMGTILGSWADAMIATLSPSKPSSSSFKVSSSPSKPSSSSTTVLSHSTTMPLKCSILSASQAEVEAVFMPFEGRPESQCQAPTDTYEASISDPAETLLSSTTQRTSVLIAPVNDRGPLQKGSVVRPVPRITPMGASKSSVLPQKCGLVRPKSGVTRKLPPSAIPTPVAAPIRKIPAPAKCVRSKVIPVPTTVPRPAATARSLSESNPKLKGAAAGRPAVAATASRDVAASEVKLTSATLDTAVSKSLVATEARDAKPAAPHTLAPAATLSYRPAPASMAAALPGSSAPSAASSDGPVMERRPAAGRLASAKRVLLPSSGTPSASAPRPPRPVPVPTNRRSVASSAAAPSAKVTPKPTSPVKPIVRAAGPGWRRANAEAAAAAAAAATRETATIARNEPTVPRLMGIIRTAGAMRGPSPTPRGPSPPSSQMSDSRSPLKQSAASNRVDRGPFVPQPVFSPTKLTPTSNSTAATVEKGQFTAESRQTSFTSSKTPSSDSLLAPSVALSSSMPPRTARVRNASQSQSEEVSNRSANATSVSAPVGLRAGIAPVIPMSAPDLARLTTRNTRKNEVWVAQLEYREVYIDGAKPPSPSAKIPRIGGAVKLSKADAATARANRAKNRTSVESERSQDDVEEALQLMQAIKEHRLGAGDAQVYQTPIRGYKAKGVRWHKALFVGPSDKYSTEPGLELGERKILAKDCQPCKSLLLKENFCNFDRHGNVSEAEHPLSPRLKKTRIIIQQFKYSIESPSDDEDE